VSHIDAELVFIVLLGPVFVEVPIGKVAALDEEDRSAASHPSAFNVDCVVLES